ncbi:hypothetical protein GOBAR_AA01871 [Gossypium barbadense]|uniref:NADH:ubiquinone oxidoreductase-like 20kDa subunit domain-containing protein n=1 Tax=Gossypium barbadense TaxID=3634 RepID=A0A2P5YSX9_GOSBA|nr:hypothetical protein GOBAR_AA01871 [Gossypium barbadense]
MPEPKYVIAMGACTITRGMFSTDSYSTVRGVDELIPVDVYLPGCPPKPEAVIDAITKLRKKISREIYEDRIRSQQGDRVSVGSRPRLPDGLTPAYALLAPLLAPDPVTSVTPDRHALSRIVPSYENTQLYTAWKISREIYEDRIRSQQGDRCFTTNHKFCLVRSTRTGNYNQGLLYQPPSTSEIPPETFFNYKGSLSSQELVIIEIEEMPNVFKV